MTYFENLSDDELTERLLNGGWTATWCGTREDPVVAAEIERALQRHHRLTTLAQGADGVQSDPQENGLITR
jgi:hypothetical protein